MLKGEKINMGKNAEIEKTQAGLINCLTKEEQCQRCPYRDKPQCKFTLLMDAVAVLQEHKALNRKDD